MGTANCSTPASRVWDRDQMVNTFLANVIAFLSFLKTVITVIIFSYKWKMTENGRKRFWRGQDSAIELRTNCCHKGRWVHGLYHEITKGTGQIPDRYDPQKFPVANAVCCRWREVCHHNIQQNMYDTVSTQNTRDSIMPFHLLRTPMTTPWSTVLQVTKLQTLITSFQHCATNYNVPTARHWHCLGKKISKNIIITHFKHLRTPCNFHQTNKHKNISHRRRQASGHYYV